MNPELKQKALALMDKIRDAFEKDDIEAIQMLVAEGLALILQIYGSNIEGLLPLVIMGMQP